MAIKRYDVVAITGSYVDRSGVEKRRYLNCGAVFETEKGLSLKLESIPVGFDGWFQLYEPRPEQPVGSPQGTRQPQMVKPKVVSTVLHDEFNDDIPF
jgi:hypothetical protein